MASRLTSGDNGAASIDLDHVANIQCGIAVHNNHCLNGQEITMEYFMTEAMAFVFKRFASLSTDQFIGVISAYAIYGHLRED